MRETSAPVKKATYKAIIIFGNPKKSPIKKANFTSPIPMPRPRVMRDKKRKNKNEPIAAKRLDIRILGYKDIKNAKEKIIPG